MPSLNCWAIWLIIGSGLLDGYLAPEFQGKEEALDVIPREVAVVFSKRILPDELNESENDRVKVDHDFLNFDWAAMIKVFITTPGSSMASATNPALEKAIVAFRD